MRIACRTSNAPERGPVDIPKHWEMFYKDAVFERIPNKASQEVIALYCDYEGDHTNPYTLVIGSLVSAVDEIPNGMVVRHIPASSYAHIRAVGEYPKCLVDAWIAIWQASLNRTYTGDYEVYGEKFAVSSSKEVDLFIAVS